VDYRLASSWFNEFVRSNPLRTFKRLATAKGASPTFANILMRWRISETDHAMIQLKRAYDAASKNDGLRILVERLWPRGVSKSDAQFDFWLKELAPSTELRKWYNHIPERWPQFRKRYWAELKAHAGILALLKHVAQRERVTFVYAAGDEDRNSAVALQEYLERDDG
jgi:uncharacterized protein YeaO (DUF488 family)